MKKTNLKEIKGLEIKDLRLKVKNAGSELAGLFLEKAQPAKGSKDVKQIFKKRKNIAQMLTILRQKEMLRELESTDKSQESSH